MVVKTQICFKIADEYSKKIEELVKAEKFASVSGFCEAAVIEYFSKKEVRDYLPAEIISFFGTQQGQELLSKLFQQQVLEAFKNIKS